MSFTACVPKKTTNNSPPPPTTEQLQSQIASLQSQITTLTNSVTALQNQSPPEDWHPTTDQLAADIAAVEAGVIELQTQIPDLADQITGLAAQVAELKAMPEEETVVEEEIDETTRWSLDAWTDYESYDLVEIELDHSRIDDGDDYTIWLLLYNTNIKDDYLGKHSIAPSSPNIGDYYYDTIVTQEEIDADVNDAVGLWQVTDISSAKVTWTQVFDLGSIYDSVLVREIAIDFDPKSGDRVLIDETQTELYSIGYPSFDWDLEVKTRADGTCKGMEALTVTRYTLPVPDSFINNDPEKPYPEEFKLEFELAYQ